MYWQHFGLSAEPFSLTPDPAFLYMSEGHAEALAALKLGLLERRGLLAMIGEVGTGKTTLLYSLLAGLEAEIKTAYVSNTRLSFDGILRTILSDFGVTPASDDRVDMLDCLNDFLVDCAERDTTAALIIDEAQNLSPEAFEEIRLLSNFETYTTKLLQIVLVGQPELATKLNERELRQINERIAVRCYLNPLTVSESRSYIEHRLEAAGGNVDAFSKRALKNIISWSSGIPRRINILCHNSLLFAYGRSLTSVTPGIVEDAIRDQEGAGLRRFDQPARYDDPGLRDAVAIAVGAAGKQVRGALGVEHGSLVRWTLGGIAAGVTGALLLTSGPGNDSSLSAVVAPTSVEAAATEVEPSRQRRPRAERRLQRLQQRRIDVPAAEPTPYTGLSAAARAELERALASPTATGDATATGASEAREAQAPEPTVETQPAPAVLDLAPAQIAAAASETAPESETENAAVSAAAEAATPYIPAAAAGEATTPAAAAQTAAQSTGGLPAQAPAPATPEPGAAPAESTVHRRVPRDRQIPPEQLVASVTASVGNKRMLGTAAGEPLTPTDATNAEHTVIVPAGGTLSGLMVHVYGFYRTELLDVVRAANPHIADPDRIRAGEVVIFPELAELTGTPGRLEDR